MSLAMVVFGASSASAENLQHSTNSAKVSINPGDYCVNPGEKTVNSFGEKLICTLNGRRRVWARYVAAAPQTPVNLSLVRSSEKASPNHNFFDATWKSPSNNVIYPFLSYWSSNATTAITTVKLAFGASSYRFELKKNGSVPICFSLSLGNEYGTTKSDSVCEDVSLLPTTTTSSTTSSTVASTVTTILGVPNTPTEFKLSITSPFDGTGKLTWVDKPGNANNFYISSVEPLKLEALDKAWYKSKNNKTSVGVKGFLRGGNYCYWILASNSVGNSVWSTSACAMAGVETTTIFSVPTTTPPIATGAASISNSAKSGTWSGCYFKGIQMWGSVFITRNPAEANVIVYRTSMLYGVDLKVFNAPYSYSATSCGMWFNTTNPSKANFKVYFTSVQAESEVSVYMTPYANLAGR
jgi:hypothetical protein